MRLSGLYFMRLGYFENDSAFMFAMRLARWHTLRRLNGLRRELVFHTRLTVFTWLCLISIMNCMIFTINCPIVTCMELFPLYELVCDKKYANAASFEKYLKLLLSTDHCSLALYALEWLVGESKARVYSRHWCELVVPFVLNGVISSGNIESSESPTVM